MACHGGSSKGAGRNRHRNRPYAPVRMGGGKTPWRAGPACVIVEVMHRLAVLLLCWLALPAPVAGQGAIRPHLDWRTLRTEHFDVHYPADVAEWTHAAVARMEAVHAAVAALVGNAPSERVTVVVEDPTNQSNASAYPFLNAPAILLWPTPPEPGEVLGHYRDWGELVAVHEFAHLAHLNRASRNARQRLLWKLLPTNVGPIARRAPRWVTEGYATHVEGRLTGSGRPHGAFRAAVLREWALAGKLPTYEQLSGSSGFFGPRMPYLVGSAFLEWLAEQRGDESLVHLWRRMTARQDRGFVEAFAGVFGGTPRDLYGRFTVEVTARALAVRTALDSAGIATGDTVQQLAWYTGEPALSSNGEHLAIVLRSASTPSRLVVWRTADEPEDSAAAAARQGALERDPEDVPAVAWRPRPKTPLAELVASNGRAAEAPRFLPDGERVLFVQYEPMGDGTVRPDLFLWQWKTGGVHRVTRGAAVRSADPAPDGQSAAGVRCLNGICDLVRIDLRSGAVRVVVHGEPRVGFAGPRIAPDGRSMVVAMQQRGRWRLAQVDSETDSLRLVLPEDGTARYAPAWLPGGDALVAVSEQGGVANLERIDLRTGEIRPLTRMVGAALAPAINPADRSVYFLALHPGGYNLQRVHPDSAAVQRGTTLDAALFPAVPRPPAAPADTFAHAPLPAPGPYGVGPRRWRVLPFGSGGPFGWSVGAAALNADPVGRLSWMAQATYGRDGAWVGGALNADYRRWPVTIAADLFRAYQDPARQGGGLPAAEPHGDQFEAAYTGATSFAEYRRGLLNRHWAARAGASTGTLQSAILDAPRHLAFAEWDGAATWRRGRRAVSASAGLHGAVGSTDHAVWTRGVASTLLGIRLGALNLRAAGTFAATGRDAPLWEQILVGGATPPLFRSAILSQRLAMPALPLGVVAGSTVATARVSATLRGLEPYLFAAGSGSDLSDWYRVAGAETSLRVASSPFLNLPAADLVLGAAYPLDAPFRHDFRVYGSLVYRP